MGTQRPPIRSASNLSPIRYVMQSISTAVSLYRAAAQGAATRSGITPRLKQTNVREGGPERNVNHAKTAISTSSHGRVANRRSFTEDLYPVFRALRSEIHLLAVRASLRRRGHSAREPEDLRPPWGRSAGKNYRHFLS